jgi:hypothetical protein
MKELKAGCSKLKASCLEQRVTGFQLFYCASVESTDKIKQDI